MSGDEARIILEAFENKIAVVIEMVDELKKQVATREDIRELRDDISVIKKAIRATNEDVRMQGERLKTLEQQIA
jgi:hypothetical protein